MLGSDYYRAFFIIRDSHSGGGVKRHQCFIRGKGSQTNMTIFKKISPAYQPYPLKGGIYSMSLFHTFTKKRKDLITGIHRILVNINSEHV